MTTSTTTTTTRMQTFIFNSSLQLKLDIYTSEGMSHDEKPSIIFFHPGGLVAYDRKAVPPHIVQACMIRGWPLICPDHRLLPQVTAKELFQDVCDAYGFVREKMWEKLGFVEKSKGKIIVAGASAAAFLATLCATHVTPPPHAILNIYGISTFQSPFFHSPASLPNPKIHRSQIAHHLTTPPTTGNTPPSEAFSLASLLSNYSKNPEYRVKPETKPKVVLNEEGLELLDRPELYDYFVQERFYPGFFEEIEKEGIRGKGELPPVVIVHGDADDLVPMSLSTEFMEKYGAENTQLFVAKGKDHLYDYELYLGDEGLKEFEQAWDALEKIVEAR